MLADGRSVSEGETVETDLCIVGAGVAGITLAHELVGRGLEVLLLESGGLARDDDTQALYRGENVGLPYDALDEARARFFGGSANYWDCELGDDRLGARLRPFDAIDFEKRDWVPHSGWPFDRRHLDPFYERAQRLLGIERTGYDAGDWDDPDARPRLPFRNDEIQTVIFKFAPQDIFTRELKNEIVRRADNVIALVHANAVEIETDEAARTVRRLRVACLRGSTFWVSAKVFVVAAGGIETPRLLLLSSRVQRPGLGNQHDLVGRFFMEHPHFWSGIYVPGGAAASLPTRLYDDVHLVDGTPIIGKLALAERVLRRERLLNQNIQLVPRAMRPEALHPAPVSRGTTSLRALRSALAQRTVPDRLGTHVANVVGGLDDVLVTAYRAGRRKASGGAAAKSVRAFRLAHIAEQAPNPDSRVTLGEDRDALGQNRVRLDWRLSPMDMLSVVRTQQIIDAGLRQAGLGRLRTALRDETPPPGVRPGGLHGGFHHMGTTRMHADPRQGVVDADCRVHGIANLFIAGPSVFPTGGYANPALTIVALAVRLADHLKGLMQRHDL